MKNCRVVSVVSGKGGVGKTAISANLAYLSANEFGLKTLLIDANITTPHVFSVMKLPTAFNLNRLLNGEKPEPEKFMKYDELHVLPSKVFMDSKDYKRIKNLHRIVKKLKPHYDVIVVDSAPGIGKDTMAAIEASDICLIVSTPFVPAIADVLRVKELMKGKEKKVKLLLNMVEGKHYEIDRRKIEHITGLPVLGGVPFDTKVMDSIATGNLISKHLSYSKFVRELRKAAYSLLSEEFYLEEKLGFLKKLLLKL